MKIIPQDQAPSRLFFTSDTHFGHENILLPTHSDRPFRSVEEQDEVMLERWNATVGPTDTIWHLGDVAWFRPGNRERLTDLITNLNGNIRCLVGNHDVHRLWPQEVIDRMEFIEERALLRIKGHGKLVDGDRQELMIHIDHYPLRSWDRKAHGGLHFHGHVHGRYDRNADPGTIDVGVDSMNFRPVSLERLLVALDVDAYWARFRVPRGDTSS